jgi:hypothetical protein
MPANPISSRLSKMDAEIEAPEAGAPENPSDAIERLSAENLRLKGTVEKRKTALRIAEGNFGSVAEEPALRARPAKHLEEK